MDLQRERQRLLERDAEWAALSSQGQDVERILSFWSDDAQVFAPGMPPLSGKEALRSYVEGALAIPGFHITWTTSEARLSVTMPGPDSRPVTSQGRAVTVWRREPDAEWRCTLDMWNDGPASG
jgi:ketosteroid isomerase-like protein